MHWAKKVRQARELISWKLHGKPVPPPHIVKQRTLKKYAQRFGLKVLVKTGTYQGEMVEAMKNQFDKIYTIELRKELYASAKRKFHGDDHIQVIHGDSAVELGKLIKKIKQPSLFWLDGHYSRGTTAKGETDTPILQELQHIFDAEEMTHAIVIDDARYFGREADYPNLEELSAFVRSRRPAATISVKNDSIRIIVN